MLEKEGNKGPVTCEHPSATRLGSLHHLHHHRLGGRAQKPRGEERRNRQPAQIKASDTGTVDKARIKPQQIQVTLMWRSRLPWRRAIYAAGAAAFGFYELHTHQSDENPCIASVRIANLLHHEKVREGFRQPWKLASGRSSGAEMYSIGNVALCEAASPDSSAAEANSDLSTADNRACLMRSSIADAAAKAAPAVVHITVTIGDMGVFVGQGAGSGVIINPNGTILTNAHVVAGYGAALYKGKVKVSMQDGRTFEGTVVSYDLASDIAVVKVDSKTPLPAAALGSSRKLRPGEWIIALGSPLHLQNSVTVGVISCVERKSSEIGLRGVHGGFIQTDAAINQGNSGGPLLNLDGEVIGINTMKAFAADGVSFAIPIDTAIRVMEQLERHGRVVRPWLGIKMFDLNEQVLSQLKEDPKFPDVTEGVLVPQVIPGSPAERAGIRAGDVIVQFDGSPIRKSTQIVDKLGDKIGVQYKVLVKRADNKSVLLTVTTEEARAQS